MILPLKSQHNPGLVIGLSLGFNKQKRIKTHMLKINCTWCYSMQSNDRTPKSLQIIPEMVAELPKT